MDFEVLCKAKPIYEEVNGWQQSTRGMTQFAKLPPQAKAYVNRLEKLLKVRIKYISTGSKRHETIVRF